MDLNRGRRRIPLSEEPRRTPWKLIVFILSGLALLAALWSALGIEIKTREVAPRIPVEEQVLIPVAPADGPPDVVEEEVVEPVPPPPGSNLQGPKWAKLPTAEFPEAGMRAPGGQGRVVLACVAGPDQSLRACRVVSETPAVYGFGRSALKGVREARLTRDAQPGAKIQFTIRFVPPGY